MQLDKKDLIKASYVCPFYHLTSPIVVFVSQIFEKKEEIKRCQGFLEVNKRGKAGISLLPGHTASKMKKAGKTQAIDQPNILLRKLIFENRQAERVIQEVRLVYLTHHNKHTNVFLL